AAHGDGAEDESQREACVFEVKTVACARDGHAHKAGQKQQLPADRAIEARELREWLPCARQRVRPMLLQRIGGFQIGHIGVMRAAFPLRKAAQTLCEPPSEKLNE